MQIKMEGRTFNVKLGEDGKALRITERKLWSPGTYHECLYNAPFWHHSHKRPQRGLAARILAEAEKTS